MRPLLPAVFLLAASAAPSQDPETTERLLRVAERRYRETPDPTDPRAAAARLGFERTKILEFVRGLAWEPYDGVLRDASGTLLCGGGNSLDRALLLQAMLEAGGERTRLMRGDVSEADREALLQAFRKRERRERPQADLKSLAAELGVDDAALEGLVGERRRREAALVEEVVEAAKSESGRITPLIGAIPGRAAPAPRDHVFVQVQDRTGWADLDPAPVPLDHRGARPLTPQELAAQRRSLTVRLLLNRKGGATSEAVPLLNVPLDYSAVSWKVVELLVQPVPGDLPAGLQLRDRDARGVLAAFLNVRQYRAVLIVGGKSFGGIPFDLAGTVYSVDPAGRVGPAKSLSGGLGKAFSGALGGGGDAAPAASALESVVLELAVREGGVERVHSRTLATAPRPGLRGLPFLRYSFLMEGAPLPPGERERRDLHVVVENAAAVRRLIRGSAGGVHFNPQADVSSALLVFGDLRRRLIERLGQGSAYVQDRIGLAAETSQVFVDEELGRVYARQGFDILENPGFFENAGERTLTLGAAETALECLLGQRLYAGDAGRSAWTAMERARLQGGKAELQDRAGRRELRWSAEAFWSVDPASGTCVGRVPSGAGQGLVETLIDSANQVCAYSDAVTFLAGASGATGRQPEWADDTSRWAGRACAAIGGVNLRNELNDKINEISKNLWLATIGSLAGL